MSDLRYGFVDQSNGNWVQAQVNPAHAEAGQFQFGIWDVGVINSHLAQATVVVDGAGVTHLSYSGPATLNVGATWRRNIGYQYYTGTHSVTVSVDFTATFAADHRTDTASITHNGATHTVSYAVPPPQNADLMLSTAMAALSASDWQGLYQTLDSDTQALVTQQEFAAAMVDGVAADGPATRWALAGPVAYLQDPGPGPRLASGNVNVRWTEAGVTTSYRAEVLLVEDQGQWRLIELTEPVESLSLLTPVAPGGPAANGRAL
ncbi:MAG: hypothetical protein ACKVPX_12110 [Myxococcaceae bacterium]